MATLKTDLCDLLNIEYPILQAGMGGVAFGPLAAAVSAAAGVRIHEGSHVHAIRHAARAGEKTIVQTGTGRVLCDHLILAANGFFLTYLALALPSLQ